MNIKEIAKIAGVGISTVSRVINNSGPASENTRKRVMDAIAAYHYVPNGSARNLKLVESRNIALLVKDITNPFFNKMIGVIEQKIALQGYSLIIEDVDLLVDELVMAIKEVKDRHLCGVIIMGGCYSYSEEKFRQLSVPCVLVTGTIQKDIDPALYSSVTLDDEEEGFRATEYLISLGHRRIGFIYDPSPEPVTPNTLRYQGYLRALEEHGIDYDPDLVVRNINTMGTGYATGFKAMKQLYSKNRNITAVFAFADILAAGAAKAILSMGLSIPGDISVLGFDGIELAEYYHPALDTVCQPATEMAQASVEVLFDMIQDNPSKHQVFKSTLVKRGSCRRQD